MQFGCCGNDENAQLLLGSGFALVELPVFNLFEGNSSQLPRERLAHLQQLRSAVRSFNCFVPGQIKVVGPDVNAEEVESYVIKAVGNMAALGGELVVFGSGGARGIPEGYALDRARDDTRRFLTVAGDIAALRGMVVAIEPLNRGECNWINSVDDAVELASSLAHPAVKVLSDLYHVSVENEGYEGTRRAGSLLAHVHVASPVTRGAVTEGDLQVLTEFFRVLKDIDYSGRIVLECGWKDMASEAPVAAGVLKEAWHAA